MSGSYPKFPVAKEAIPSILKSHGIQATAQRVEIAAILLAEKQHLSADQVLSRVSGGWCASLKGHCVQYPRGYLQNEGSPGR